MLKHQIVILLVSSSLAAIQAAQASPPANPHCVPNQVSRMIGAPLTALTAPYNDPIMHVQAFAPREVSVGKAKPEDIAVFVPKGGRAVDPVVVTLSPDGQLHFTTSSKTTAYGAKNVDATGAIHVFNDKKIGAVAQYIHATTGTHEIRYFWGDGGSAPHSLPLTDISGKLLIGGISHDRALVSGTDSTSHVWLVDSSGSTPLPVPIPVHLTTDGGMFTEPSHVQASNRSLLQYAKQSALIDLDGGAAPVVIDRSSNEPAIHLANSFVLSSNYSNTNLPQNFTGGFGIYDPVGNLVKSVHLSDSLLMGMAKMESASSQYLVGVSAKTEQDGTAVRAMSQIHIWDENGNEKKTFLAPDVFPYAQQEHLTLASQAAVAPVALPNGKVLITVPTKYIEKDSSGKTLSFPIFVHHFILNPAKLDEELKPLLTLETKSTTFPAPIAAIPVGQRRIVLQYRDAQSTLKAILADADTLKPLQLIDTGGNLIEKIIPAGQGTTRKQEYIAIVRGKPSLTYITDP